MRYFLGILFAILTAALIFILDTKVVLPSPLGRLLAPQQGFWQNAESLNENFTASINTGKLKGRAEVYFDERLVPHVFAEQTHDAYFVQGYIHAKFRLWQMELQTLAAAGRVSEVVGEKGLQHDREFRRLGMVFGAENSLALLNGDQEIKATCDAYTEGVNAYITSLTPASLPLEYKLTGTKPELWSNLKTALFLKYMSYDLAGHENDFEMTNARNFFAKEDFDKLFPLYQDSLDPIIPKGTKFAEPMALPKKPVSFDSLYIKKDSAFAAVESFEKPDAANGSNNWAVSGSKTRTGAPILCNDPHLGLNIPSLWFEMQISTPDFNAYGATFPGAPSVIIGFNDSCAFGFTNGGRDVRDYYEIKFKDDSRKEYWFNGAWRQTDFRKEIIKIAGKPDFIDTVAYTVFGPVMYDKRFAGKLLTNTKNYAVRWKGQDESNELRIFYELNRAKNYADYTLAAQHLKTPGQNCLFAAKNGDIAIRTQGEFPAKWKGQGDFIMPGLDSTYMWQAMIPQLEVPYQYNPERGFVSSANQRPVDTTYPYYLGREYPTPRGVWVNRMLAQMSSITPKMMMDLQLDNHNTFAEMAMPVFKRGINASELSVNEKKFLDSMLAWDFTASAGSKAQTIFEISWSEFKKRVFSDEYARAPKPIIFPYESTLMEMVTKDTAYKFIDDVSTSKKETLREIATSSFKTACSKLDSIDKAGNLAWGSYKQTKIYHLAKIPELSTDVLQVSGTANALNSNKMYGDRKQAHGPSWRMVVSLTPETEAYGIYPGGQSGNPGSRFYTSFVGDWVQGKYYSLWMMKKSESADKRVLGKMIFN